MDVFSHVDKAEETISRAAHTSLPSISVVLHGSTKRLLKLTVFPTPAGGVCLPKRQHSVPHQWLVLSLSYAFTKFSTR